MDKYLGIDVGGTEIKYALMTEEEILEKSYMPTPLDSKEEFIETIGKIYDRYADQTKVIVMSAPGRINAETGYFYTAGMLTNILSETDAASLIRQRCGITEVAIENDGKCAGMAELWKGNLKGVRNGVVLGIGSGIAGALIVDGKLYRGAHFSAGEASLVSGDFSADYLSTIWGFTGATPALIRRYAQLTGEDPSSLNGRILFDRLSKGDEKAREALNAFCQRFVQGIVSMQAIMDAERYCIGGGISQQPILIETMNKMMDEFYDHLTMSIPVQKPEIMACKFHNDANLIGALYHYLYDLK